MNQHERFYCHCFESDIVDKYVIQHQNKAVSNKFGPLGRTNSDTIFKWDDIAD